jgi:hypothetical protein
MLLALLVMNTGLYAQNFQVATLDGQSFNIINSVTEYIAEVILQKQNAFPEDGKSNPHQQQKHHLHVKAHVVKEVCENKLTQNIKFTPIAETISSSSAYIYNSYTVEITPPPPKA